MNGCCVEILPLIKTVIISWLFELHLMREVNLKLQITMTNFVLTATEKATTTTLVFSFMGSLSGGEIVLEVDVDRVVVAQRQEEGQAVLVGVAGATTMHLLYAQIKQQWVPVAAMLRAGHFMLYQT